VVTARRAPHCDPELSNNLLSARLAFHGPRVARAALGRDAAYRYDHLANGCIAHEVTAEGLIPPVKLLAEPSPIPAGRSNFGHRPKAGLRCICGKTRGRTPIDRLCEVEVAAFAIRRLFLDLGHHEAWRRTIETIDGVGDDRFRSLEASLWRSAHAALTDELDDLVSGTP
jgi:hypothetical protein